MARLDTSNAPGFGGFTPLDEGVYPWRITDAEETTSRNEDAMFRIVLQGENEKSKKTKVWDWIMLTGKGAGMGKKKLQAILGRPLEDGEEINAMDLMNLKVWAWIKHRKYTNDEGEERTGYNVDIGSGDCGYAVKSRFPWPGEGKPNVTPGNVESWDFNDVPGTDEEVPF